MSAWFWLLIWIGAIVGSIAFHEWAHVIVAKAYGWNYNGITFKWWVAGVGVKLERDDETTPGLWAIAAAGPVATFLAAFIAFYIGGFPVEGLQTITPSLVAFNIAVGLINLVPSPITDGGHIITGLTGVKMRWRYTIYFWIMAELLATYYWFFH